VLCCDLRPAPSLNSRTCPHTVGVECNQPQSPSPQLTKPPLFYANHPVCLAGGSQKRIKQRPSGDPRVMTWSRGAPKEASFWAAKKRGDGGNHAIDLCTSRHGGGEPDDWLPRACAWRPGHYRGGEWWWQIGSGGEEETFLRTHPFDPGRLAMMPAIMPNPFRAWASTCVPACRAGSLVPSFGTGGKGSELVKGLTSCRYFTGILGPVKSVGVWGDFCR
jgi:hypothetical protein